MFIELPDFQEVIYYLGIKYTFESAYRGRIYSVFDCNNEQVEPILEGKIINKYIVTLKSN